MATPVKVVLRVRPFLPSDHDSSDTSPPPCITLLGEDDLPATGGGVAVSLKDQRSRRSECYHLDSFFGEADGTGRIYEEEVKGLIPGLFQGINATVLAFGATRSGKTYTMQGTDDEPGLIPLSMSAILAMCDNISPSSSIEISFCEIYMERCYDLLETGSKEIMVLDDKDGNVQLKGISLIPVRSMDEFCEIYSTGVQQRKVAHTKLNDTSSRSHAVLAIVVTTGVLKGTLNLIDLAGNEDNRRSCNEGNHLQESAKINQSLFALSKVIHALDNNQQWIPYRESKLTRILRDSLGGTSHTLMITCLNPASYQEAIHTLSLALRSRHVVNYTGSTAKKDSARMKSDMEIKLKTWLQSKGKTKSVQRINGLWSPLTGQSSKSISDINCSIPFLSSARGTPMHQGVSNPRGRKLFESEVKDLNAVKDNQRTGSCKKTVADVHHGTSLSDCSSFMNGEGCQLDGPQWDDINLEFYEKTGSCKKMGAVVHHGTLLDDCSTFVKEEDCQLDVPLHRNLVCYEVAPGILHKPDKEREKNVTCALHFSNTLHGSGTPSDQENFNRVSADVVSSISTAAPLSERHTNFSNILPFLPDDMVPAMHPLSDDRICIPLDPKTPKTPCDKDKSQVIGTPADTFNILSSNLKESVVEEYISFLNTASEEELLQLKGIGPKRAECIIQLRENTPNPLKSLSDLEKIGLSSKQVHNMFTKAARGIFT